MTIRYIIRPPSIRTTPRKLKEILGAERTVNPRTTRRLGELDWVHDLFLYYPRLPNEVTEYTTVREFMCNNKYEQRQYLHTYGVKTPDDYESELCVVRPLRHRGGESFRIIENRDHSWNLMTEYISYLFPKVREYRIIFCKSVPLVTLSKVFPDRDTGSLLSSSSTPPCDVPWNHACGSRFITVQYERSYLRHSSVLQDLLNVPVVQHAHIVAADIMLNADHEYAVCELNFCPAITIESNLQTIKDHLCPTM